MDSFEEIILPWPIKVTASFAVCPNCKTVPCVFPHVPNTGLMCCLFSVVCTMYICASVCIFINVCACVCASLCVHIYAYVFMNMACMCTCVCMHTCMCVCMHTHMCVYACSEYCTQSLFSVGKHFNAWPFSLVFFHSFCHWRCFPSVLIENTTWEY